MTASELHLIVLCAAQRIWQGYVMLVCVGEDDDDDDDNVMNEMMRTYLSRVVPKNVCPLTAPSECLSPNVSLRMSPPLHAFCVCCVDDDYNDDDDDD